ncbi:MAG TPA: hypothetical protein VFA12_11180 [Stellaceae bacterium]|nr:hypothetical protein [Stellaceae bacterium]
MTSNRHLHGLGRGAWTAGVAALLLTLAPTAAFSGEAPPLARLLIGNTLSAVTYVPHPPGAPGGGELSRIMLQAYLRGDGSAVVRIWDTFADAYTVPVDRPWALNGSTLCLDLPKVPQHGFPPSICADIHIWGPRIAGIGVKPYAMLDGDLQPGNLIARNP